MYKIFMLHSIKLKKTNFIYILDFLLNIYHFFFTKLILKYYFIIMEKKNETYLRT